MWDAVNSFYKSTNKNVKKISRNLPSFQSVSKTLHSIRLPEMLPAFKEKKPPSSEVQKIVRSILNNQKSVMPVNKMNLVAELSYTTEFFYQIWDLIHQKISRFKFNAKQAKKTLNALVLSSYLIKNAVSGFVDEFRQNMEIFHQHEKLNLEASYVTDQKQLQRLKPLIFQIRQRAKYIIALLRDNKRLLQQKQIAMQIKRKIIQNGQKQNRSGFHNHSVNDLGQRYSQNNENIDSFLEHYVWKYWNKFDQKIEGITESILHKIDEYLNLQQPDNFEIEQIDSDQCDNFNADFKTQTHFEEAHKIKSNEERFLVFKNNPDQNDESGDQFNLKQQKGPVLQTDLI